jgi:membrane protein
VSFIDRVDRFQRRHSVLGFPLGVLYKFFDDTGAYLAALIAYYAFISLFPALLLLTTVLGIVLSGNPDLQKQILDSTFSQFPVVGDQLKAPGALNGGPAAVVVGVLGSVYGGLGVAQAVQHAMNTMWSVPRNSRPNPILARGKSILLLLVGGLSVLVATALTTLANSDILALSGRNKDLAVVLSIVLNGLLFALVFKLATGRPLKWRQLAPGAILASLFWHVMQTFGVIYVERVVNNASNTTGVFAIVLGLVAFLHLTALAIVFSAEVNVVLALRIWPRALLTPFTDDVDLTSGDKRAYEDLAQAQRLKGQQTIEVEFGERPKDPD